MGSPEGPEGTPSRVIEKFVSDFIAKGASNTGVVGGYEVCLQAIDILRSGRMRFSKARSVHNSNRFRLFELLVA